MVWKAMLGVLLVTVVVGGLGRRPVGNPLAAMPVASDPDLAKPARKKPGKGYIDDCTGDAVTVGKDAITIRVPGVGLRQFPLGGVLAGQPPVGPHGAQSSYRLTDVQVGDRVAITYQHEDGVERCLEILIHRRPGGKIPLRPGDERAGTHAWHLRAQAYQDWEEKGVALPPKYSKNLPRWVLNPPYPPEAPAPPREIQPRPEVDDTEPDKETLRKSWTFAKAEWIELVNGSFEGTVAATGDGWLLIRPDGRVAKRFLASDLLAAGRPPEGSAPLADVRTGDRVEVWYDRFDGENVLREVRVTRRAETPPAGPLPIPAAKD